MSSQDEAPAPLEAEPDTVRLTRSEIRRAATPSQGAAPVSEVESPGLLVCAVMVALAALVGLSAVAGPNATAVSVGFCGVVLVWGWAPLVDAPDPRSATLVVAGGVVAIVVTVGLTRTEPFLTWVPVALAVSVMAAFLREVFRPHGRPLLTHGVAGSVGALAVVTSGATIAALPHYAEGADWMLAAMLAVALTAAVQLLAAWRPLRRWLLGIAVLVGALGALAVAATAGGDGVRPLGAVVMGALVAAIAHSMLRVLLALPGAAGLQAKVAAAAASVLVVGVLVYVVARVYAA